MILTNKNIELFSIWKEQILKDGVTVLIDKEKDWTSFDVCAKLRGMAKTRKIGHAGTLDPLATGLLIVCIGKSTKKIESFQSLEKEYRAIIKIGATTKTDDAAQEEEEIKDYSFLTSETIINTFNSFLGKSLQAPPRYSARKVKGKRLYELARKNIEVEVAPREIEVLDLNINEIALPNIDVTLKVTKGTYIRAIARDLGQKLNTGGYLTDLRRTKIGEYNVEDALTIDKLQNLFNLYNENI